MRITILIILMIFSLNTCTAQTITTLSDGRETKEITFEGTHSEFLEISNSVVIASAEMDVSGSDTKSGGGNVLIEIDKYKTSYDSQYCTQEDSYCFGVMDNKMFQSKLVLSLSKAADLTKLGTHTLHSDYFGGEPSHYRLTICKSTSSNAMDAECSDKEFVLVSDGVHIDLPGPVPKHPTSNYDEQVVENSYVIQPNTNYLMTWKPLTLNLENMVARKIDFVGEDLTPVWKLDIGNNLKKEWGTAGIFNETIKVLFTEELNEVLNKCDCEGCVKGDKCKIPINFDSNTQRKITISNIKIETKPAVKGTTEPVTKTKAKEESIKDELKNQTPATEIPVKGETKETIKSPAEPEKKGGSNTFLIALAVIAVIIILAVIYYKKIKTS